MKKPSAKFKGKPQVGAKTPVKMPRDGMKYADNSMTWQMKTGKKSKKPKPGAIHK